MKGKERIRALLDGKPADRRGFWIGNPADETKIKYSKDRNQESEYIKTNPIISPIIASPKGAAISLQKPMNFASF